jgi:hypothetical protein
MPGRFTPGTHLIGWLDLRVRVENMEKRKFFTLLGLELRPLSHPACCSQSLYRVRYPGSFQTLVLSFMFSLFNGAVNTLDYTTFYGMIIE